MEDEKPPVKKGWEISSLLIIIILFLFVDLLYQSRPTPFDAVMAFLVGGIMDKQRAILKRLKAFGIPEEDIPR